MTKLNRKQLVEALCALYGFTADTFEGMAAMAIRQWMGRSLSIGQMLAVHRYCKQEQTNG